jgi:hypothetical protein
LLHIRAGLAGEIGALTNTRKLSEQMAALRGAPRTASLIFHVRAHVVKAAFRLLLGWTFQLHNLLFASAVDDNPDRWQR